jgi:hypothetical protein
MMNIENAFRLEGSGVNSEQAVGQQSGVGVKKSGEGNAGKESGKVERERSRDREKERKEKKDKKEGKDKKKEHKDKESKKDKKRKDKSHKKDKREPRLEDLYDI